MGTCCSCCSTSHHRQVIDRLYPTSDATTIVTGTEEHLVPDHVKNLVEYAIPRVFKLPIIGGELEARILRDIRKQRVGFVLVGVIATWHLMADKTVPLVGYYDKNVLTVTRALLASSDSRLRVAGAETYIKLIQAQNEILVNFSKFDEFLLPILDMCSGQGKDGPALLVRKAGITAVRELLVCKAKVPAGDDPGSLHLNHIVPVVLRILRDESGSNETKSQADEPPPYQFSNPHLPSYEASLHDLAMRCFESIAVLASNPLATHVVLDPTFAFLDLCGFQPVLFSLTVCLTIQDKTNRPVFTHLLQHLKRLDAHGLKSLPEGEEVDGGDGSGSLGAGIGPGIQLTQGGHARRMQPQTRLETKTAVLQVVEQLVSQSSAYVPAESFTLLAPQVVASPPRNTLNLQRHYDNFQEQVKRCLEKFSVRLATIRGFVDCMALMLGELQNLDSVAKQRLLSVVLHLTTQRIRDDDVFVIKEIVPLLAAATDDEPKLRLLALRVWLSLLPFDRPRDWSAPSDAQESQRMELFQAALYFSSLHTSNAREHTVVLSNCVRKLLRCSGIRHQALFVPWALAVQADLKRRQDADSTGGHSDESDWPQWAKLGHQLVAGVLAGVAAELPCQRLFNYVHSVMAERRRVGVNCEGLAINHDGRLAIVNVDARQGQTRGPGTLGAGAGAEAGAGALDGGAGSGTSLSTGQRADLTYWTMLGGRMMAQTLFDKDVVNNAVIWSPAVRNAMDSRALSSDLLKVYKPRTPEDDEDSVAQTEDYTRELLDDDEVSLDDLDLGVQARPAPQATARNGQSVLSLSFADLVQDTQRLGEQQVIISVLEKLVSAPHLERQRDALGLAQGFDFAKVYQRHTFMRVTTQDFHTVTAANDYDLYSA